jgi:hypothetical protein
MECRVCNQPISFIKGSYPGRKRRSTRAVHESELSESLRQANGEVVTPHPGVQRKLRLELEGKHGRQLERAGETPERSSAPDAPEQTENTEMYSKVSA